MSETRESLKALAGEIRQETAPSANTAEKIGSALEGIIDYAAEANVTLAARFSTEQSTRSAADTALEERLSTEKSRAEGAESTLREALETEQTVRSAADTALQTSLSTEQRRAEGVEGTLRRDLTAEQSARVAADTALQTSLSTEQRRAEGVEGTLREDLATEQATRAAADTALQTSLSTEQRRAEDAESMLREDLTDEQSSRLAAETALSATLEQESSHRMSRETVRFDGFQLCPDATDNSPHKPEAIYFDGSKNQFVGLRNGVYYTSWPDSVRLYNADSHRIYEDKVYLFGGRTYVWDGSTLFDSVSGEATAREAADASLSASLAHEIETRSQEYTALASAVSLERDTREAADTALEGRIAGLESVSVITNEEMDAVLGGPLAVYLADANGNAVLDENGNPIEIIE